MTEQTKEAVRTWIARSTLAGAILALLFVLNYHGRPPPPRPMAPEELALIRDAMHGRIPFSRLTEYHDDARLVELFDLYLAYCREHPSEIPTSVSQPR